MNDHILYVDFGNSNPNSSPRDLSPGIDALIERFDYFRSLQRAYQIYEGYFRKVQATSAERRVVQKYFIDNDLQEDYLDFMMPAEFSALESFLYKFCRYEMEWKAELARGCQGLSRLRSQPNNI